MREVFGVVFDAGAGLAPPLCSRHCRCRHGIAGADDESTDKLSMQINYASNDA
jgi:hypothetical protein